MLYTGTTFYDAADLTTLLTFSLAATSHTVRDVVRHVPSKLAPSASWPRVASSESRFAVYTALECRETSEFTVAATCCYDLTWPCALRCGKP